MLHINKHEFNAVTCLLLLISVIKQYPHKQQTTKTKSGAVQGKVLGNINLINKSIINGVQHNFN
jgi:hypothetical protein